MNQQTTRTTVLARFLSRLNLPEGGQQDIEDAAEAVRREYRSSTPWKRLRCRQVAPLSDEPGENVFILEVGHSVQFDWTWEGATAFRPADIDSFQGDIDLTDDFVDVDPVNGCPNGQRAIWSGEVVEVDETNGRLFVSVASAHVRPCTGSFFVRPFEFLTFLHSVYCQSEAGFKRRLGPSLKASCGAVHPSIHGASASWPDEVKHIWGHSWGILWGPPGTGKTYTLAHQVASYVNDPGERILVLSTTNRATDAAALATGMAARLISLGSVADGRILRLGSGADWTDY
jgi:AAA domain